MNGSTKVAGWLLPIIAGAGSGLMQGAATGFAPNAPAQPVNWAPAGTNTQTQQAAQAASTAEADAAKAKAEMTRTLTTLGVVAACVAGLVLLFKMAFSGSTTRRRR